MIWFRLCIVSIGIYLKTRFCLANNYTTFRWKLIKDVTSSTSYLFDGELHSVIPDVETFEKLKQVFEAVATADSYGSGIKLGSPLLSLKRKDNSPDEIMRVELLFFKTIERIPTVVGTFKIGAFFNPAICVFRNLLLMSYRGSLWADPKAYLSWLNNSFMPYPPETMVYGISGGGTFLDDGLLGAEDIRLLPLSNGEILLSFAKIVGMVGREYRVSMKASILRISPFGMAVISEPTFLAVEEQQFRSHKNWSPFLYGSSVYFIVDAHPLRIVQLPLETLRTIEHDDSDDEEGKTETHLKCELVSLTHCPNLKWDYGAMRGGSPAVFVPDIQEYLTFFHSKYTLPGSGYATYFVGAYTFSAQPPFQIRRISQVPIAKDDWYTGEWCNQGKQDYIMFPIGFVLMKNNGTLTVVLSLGRNDREGWIAMLPLPRLIKSLIPVQCD